MPNIINRVGQYRIGPWPKRSILNIRYLTVHHTASRRNFDDDAMLRNHMQTHLNNGWQGLSYHFMISGDGNIYKINDYGDRTPHDAVNWDSIGVCLDGYFHPDINEHPTDKQLQALQELLDYLRAELNLSLSSVVGHRDRSATACPGDHLINHVLKYKNTGFITDNTINMTRDQECKQELEWFGTQKNGTNIELHTDLINQGLLRESYRLHLQALKDARDQIEYLNIKSSELEQAGQDNELRDKIKDLSQDLQLLVDRLASIETEQEAA